MPYGWFFKKIGDPNLYMDYYGLPNPFETRIPIQITNTENIKLWFKAKLSSYPTGYTVTEQKLGSVDAGSSGTFVYSGISRTKPTYPIDDSIVLRAEAYTDDTYATSYGNAYQDLPLTYELFDRTHSDYTIIDEDNFDNQTLEGWTINPEGRNAYYKFDDAVYLSSPFGLQIEQHGTGGAAWSYGYRFMTKNFTIPADSYTRAYLVIHYRYRGGTYDNVYPAIWKGSTMYIPHRLLNIRRLNWIRIVLKLTVGGTETINFVNENLGSYTGDYPEEIFWVDDIFAVAK